MRNAKEAFRSDPNIEVGSALPGWICLRIRPDTQLKTQVVGFFRSEFQDLPGDLCEKLTLALDELLGNAIEHGSSVSPKSSIEFTCIRTSRMILFQIKDTGSGFSLNDIPHAALNNPPDDPLRHTEFRLQKGMRPGGFGIMMVKQIADDLMYNEQGNEVVMVKYLD
ncbi:MAG: ATP-binding protein [Acidobacteriaceae bacterium]|nr:ATP-binding protein [Acidobacteriaceae bacterium]MBV9781051.1 ATP-binding protein [Acidobacteriaceae bacterium]